MRSNSRISHFPIGFILIIIFAVLMTSCENQTEPTSVLPHTIADAKLITPQQDGVCEKDVQINQAGTTIYYNRLYSSPCYQYIFDPYHERNALPFGGEVLKLAPNEQYIVYLSNNGPDAMFLERMDLLSENHFQITNTLAAFGYCISPDSSHIAYFAYYGYPPNTVTGIFLIPPDGDTDKVLITECGSGAPICWLSNHELIVRINHGVGCDIIEYDTDNPGQEGELFYTVADATNYPLGYSETINVNEGWYIDSFYEYPDIQWGKNLYKCPIGVPGDYGEQLTEGGNNDYPGNLAANGHTFVFSREYRDDYEFLTGHRDVYLMNLE